MSVKVHEAFSIDSFQDRLLWWDDFLGDQVKDEWNVFGIVGASSANVIDQQTGGIVRLATGALTNDQVLIAWADIRSLHVDQKVTMEVRAKLSSTAQILTSMALFFDGNNRISIEYTPAAGATWSIVCVNGGAPTALSSGIAADTDYHIFRIECFPTDEVHFYIDRVETTNSPITTNIPDDVADYLQPYFLNRTLEDVAKSMDIDYVVVRQEI